jgi:hypothetical protein
MIYRKLFNNSSEKSWLSPLIKWNAASGKFRHLLINYIALFIYKSGLWRRSELLPPCLFTKRILLKDSDQVGVRRKTSETPNCGIQWSQKSPLFRLKSRGWPTSNIWPEAPVIRWSGQVCNNGRAQRIWRLVARSGIKLWRSTTRPTSLGCGERHHRQR